MGFCHIVILLEKTKTVAGGRTCVSVTSPEGLWDAIVWRADNFETVFPRPLRKKKAERIEKRRPVRARRSEPGKAGGTERNPGLERDETKGPSFTTQKRR